MLRIWVCVKVRDTQNGDLAVDIGEYQFQTNPNHVPGRCNVSKSIVNHPQFCHKWVHTSHDQVMKIWVVYYCFATTMHFSCRFSPLFGSGFELV